MNCAAPVTRWGRLRARDIPVALLAAPLAGWAHLAFYTRAPDAAVQRCVPRRTRIAPNTRPDEWLWLVGRATDFALRKVPPRPAKCTIQATTRTCLLRLAGIDATYVSGVDKHPVHGLRFHAWVEYDGRPLYEVDDVSTYLRLLSFPERS